MGLFRKDDVAGANLQAEVGRLPDSSQVATWLEDKAEQQDKNMPVRRALRYFWEMADVRDYPWFEEVVGRVMTGISMLKEPGNLSPLDLKIANKGWMELMKIGKEKGAGWMRGVYGWRLKLGEEARNMGMGLGSGVILRRAVEQAREVSKAGYPGLDSNWRERTRRADDPWIELLMLDPDEANKVKKIRLLSSSIGMSEYMDWNELSTFVETDSLKGLPDNYGNRLGELAALSERQMKEVGYDDDGSVALRIKAMGVVNKEDESGDVDLDPKALMEVGVVMGGRGVVEELQLRFGHVAINGKEALEIVKKVAALPRAEELSTVDHKHGGIEDELRVKVRERRLERDMTRRASLYANKDVWNIVKKFNLPDDWIVEGQIEQEVELLNAWGLDEVGKLMGLDLELQKENEGLNTGGAPVQKLMAAASAVSGGRTVMAPVAVANKEEVGMALMSDGGHNVWKNTIGMMQRLAVETTKRAYRGRNVDIEKLLRSRGVEELASLYTEVSKRNEMVRGERKRASEGYGSITELARVAGRMRRFLQSTATLVIPETMKGMSRVGSQISMLGLETGAELSGWGQIDFESAVTEDCPVAIGIHGTRMIEKVSMDNPDLLVRAFMLILRDGGMQYFDHGYVDKYFQKVADETGIEELSTMTQQDQNIGSYLDMINDLSPHQYEMFLEGAMKVLSLEVSGSDGETIMSGNARGKLNEILPKVLKKLVETDYELMRININLYLMGFLLVDEQVDKNQLIKQVKESNDISRGDLIGWLEAMGERLIEAESDMTTVVIGA